MSVSMGKMMFISVDVSITRGILMFIWGETYQTSVVILYKPTINANQPANQPDVSITDGKLMFIWGEPYHKSVVDNYNFSLLHAYTTGNSDAHKRRYEYCPGNTDVHMGGNLS